MFSAVLISPEIYISIVENPLGTILFEALQHNAIVRKYVYTYKNKRKWFLISDNFISDVKKELDCITFVLESVPLG